ncbi:MerR family transcriptional regulator [Candidatus Roizmanbacteria bacterium]|nr:MerR family transcriptional regulator [Candidatus Roizmanbacteria bacterium]
MRRIFVTEARSKKIKGSIIIGKTQLLRIGELAKTTSELPSTLRYWTQQKLLEIVETTRGGYWLYHSSMVERVKEIRKLQREKRLTITELRTHFNNLSTNRISKTIFRY